MWWRENIIGILLLIFCAVAAAIMISAIITGERPTVPAAARIPITIIGVVGMGALLWQQVSRWFRNR
ncbi:MAG: hypothetical protein KC435_04210 [Thermomicrobiales bacterium]|nr:hypothetical protein [Thermomicrobiales bacterium]